MYNSFHKNFEAKSSGIPHIWTFTNISYNSLEKYTQSSQSKSQTFYQWVYVRAVQVRWQVVQSELLSWVASSLARDAGLAGSV